jgi:hypothetical protein
MILLVYVLDVGNVLVITKTSLFMISVSVAGCQLIISGGVTIIIDTLSEPLLAIANLPFQKATHRGSFQTAVVAITKLDTASIIETLFEK